MTAAAAVVGAGPAESSTAGKRLTLPALSLTAAVSKLTVSSYRGRVWANLGVYAVAGDEPFQVWANRSPDYNSPITAYEVTSGGNVSLPAGLIKNFRGLSAFMHLVVTDNKSGDVALHRLAPFCPSNNAQRSRVDAPDTSTFPLDCPYNPFSLGGVYGLDAGYAVPAMNPYRAMRLDPGTYTATVTVTNQWRSLLGLTPDETTASVILKVVKGSGCVIGSEPVPAPRGCKSPISTGSRRTPAAAQPMSAAPSTAPTLAPDPSVEPDLRPLPAFGISLSKRGYLSFAATVWNAGPSPLVVDGFRSTTDENTMDAYQYFYSADGTPAGYDTAGSMVWDPRPGHDHWHFEDFAQYQLLDKDKNVVVKSRKEAFCLANTDDVDYTVPGADWRPYNTDLSTSCGDFSALSVREVLLAGSGDTYYQSLPGQSFKVGNLPNGIYYVRIAANPFGVLHEADTTNNVVDRKIRLSGSGTNRVVTVFPYGSIAYN